MTVNEATWQFVDEHLAEDVRQLALKKSKYKDIDFEFALQQIQGRQKTRDKLPYLGSFPRFVFPPSLALEQCSSELTAQYKVSFLEELIYENVFQGVSPENCGSMADLTGGFGIDTFFLSGMFETCHYVEPQQQLCDILSHNMKLFPKHNIVVHRDTMEHYIEYMDAVDFLYLDPSRRDIQGRKVSGLESCVPNVLQYKHLLLQKSRMVMLKLSPMLDVKRALNQLPETKDIMTLSVRGECKELILVLTKDADATVRYHAVNLQNEEDGFSDIRFDFTDEEEKTTLPLYANKLHAFLYEPNASVMKAGGFKCIATRFNLEKLHPHSHLYTSDVLMHDFPGRVFRVQEALPLKQAQMALKDIRQANVAVRNFPIAAEELKKRLKLTDGGEVYVFGTTMEKNRKLIIICSKEK